MQSSQKTISSNEENEKNLFMRYCKELAGLVLVIIQYKSTWVLKAAKNWLRVHLLLFLIGEDENTLLLGGLKGIMSTRCVHSLDPVIQISKGDFTWNVTLLLRKTWSSSTWREWRCRLGHGTSHLRLFQNVCCLGMIPSPLMQAR